MLLDKGMAKVVVLETANFERSMLPMDILFKEDNIPASPERAVVGGLISTTASLLLAPPPGMISTARTTSLYITTIISHQHLI